MTVENRTNEAKDIYERESIEVDDTFSITFPFLKNENNIKVLIRKSDNTKTYLTLGTDYELTDTQDGIKMLTAYNDIKRICIYRAIPLKQSRDFDSPTVFGDVTEDALDTLTMIEQDRLAAKTRYVRISEDDERDTSSLVLKYAPLRANSLLYQTSDGTIGAGTLENSGSIFKALRQPSGEKADDSFAISSERRAGNILAFDADTSNVKFIPIYSAGENIQISDQNVISATSTEYTAGTNITINADNSIDKIDTTYSAGNNITINNGIISATSTEYTAGANITINADNSIDKIDTTYSAGNNVTITNGVISAVDTTYSAGTNIQISDQNVISATDTKYSAGNNVIIANGVISAVDTTYSAGTNITIDDNNKISAVNPEFTAGTNIVITDKIISSDILSIKIADVSDWSTASINNLDYYSVCYGNGTYVAVSHNASKRLLTGSYSTNGGKNWNTMYMPIVSKNWYSVCYGQYNGSDRFVAVANDTAAAYSTDGINWTAITLPSSQNWYSVCYGNDKFIAVGNNSNIIVCSTDGGESWFSTTILSTGTAYEWNTICYGNGRFVMTAWNSNIVAISDNGTNFELRTISATNRNWRSICYGNGIFVAVEYGTNIMAYSTDGGETWQEGELPSSLYWRSVCYGSGIFVAVAYHQTDALAYSADGITWHKLNMPSDQNWRSVCYGDNEFVAVAGTDNKAAYTSTKSIAELIQAKIGG